MSDYLYVLSFIEWKNSLCCIVLGGRIVYDVHGHHKWVKENDLLNYWKSCNKTN